MSQLLLAQITAKKRQLDALGPLPASLRRNLYDWYRVELTYTSNAIEGNTLTRQETALVVQEGRGVEGKSVRELLEARNHAEALDFLYALVEHAAAEGAGPGGWLTEDVILVTHQRILRGIDDAEAGRYRHMPVRVTGSRTVFPNHMRVQDRMHDFVEWLHETAATVHPIQLATQAHYRLVSIHPFVDGNGRTGRLIMNALALQADYPPLIVRPERRRRYLETLELAQTTSEVGPYNDFMLRAALASMDDVLAFLSGQAPSEELPDGPRRTLSRQELAGEGRVTPATVKHYTELGLLPFDQASPRSRRRYDRTAALARLRQIAELREEGLTLEEIAARLAGRRAA